MHIKHLELLKDPLELDIKGVEQDLIPCMGQLKLPKVPDEGWIIDPNIHDILDGTCYVVSLPTHNGEVVHPGMMPYGISMVIDGGRSPKVFLKPFLKVPCRLTSALLITLQPVTLIPVYYSTFLCDVILLLRGHQETSYDINSLEMDLDPILIQMFLKLLLELIV